MGWVGGRSSRLLGVVKDECGVVFKRGHINLLIIIIIISTMVIIISTIAIIILRLDTVPLVALAVAGCCLLLLWVILRY